MGPNNEMYCDQRILSENTTDPTAFSLQCIVVLCSFLQINGEKFSFTKKLEVCISNTVTQS